MKWFAKRSLRAIARRSSERLEAEFGGAATAEMLGVAAAFACRPDAGGEDDGLIRHLLFQTRERGVVPCPAPEANRHLEAWLDYGLITSTEFFQRVWSISPADLLSLLFEQADASLEDRPKPRRRESQPAPVAVSLPLEGAADPTGATTAR